MRKKILEYQKKMDAFLEHPPEDTDYAEEARRHLIQIQFFMHERLVHEIVMALFAVVTVMVFLVLVLYPKLILAGLLVVLLVLLVPYIMHYYVLENGVQYMYQQYDELERRCRRQQKQTEK